MRIEVGPRDVEQGTCVAARRDRPGKEGKQFGVPLETQGFVAAVQKLLDDVQVRCAALSLAAHPHFHSMAFRRPGPQRFLLESGQIIWLCHCDHSPESLIVGCVALQ